MYAERSVLVVVYVHDSLNGMLGLPMDCMSKLLLSESKSIVQDTGCSLCNTCSKAVIQRF